jgi:PBP1b-binding outer membrane lipoprotein LpoB
MKHRFSLLLIVLFFLPSLACYTMTGQSVNGSGSLQTQTFDVSNFDRVRLDGFGDVYVEQGDVESLTVQTDENILPYLDIKVSGNELQLSVKPNVNLNPSKSIKYNLTVKDLSRIALNGSGKFYVSPIQSDSMDLSVNGSGDIKVDDLSTGRLSMNLNGSGTISIDKLKATSTDASINGSGDIKLAGEAPTQEISFNGSGNYLAGDMKSESANIRIPGSADITVWVTDTLKANIDGSGTVRYYGKPTVDQTGNGSGKLVSLGEK